MNKLTYEENKNFKGSEFVISKLHLVILMDPVISETSLWSERTETFFQLNSFNKYMSAVLYNASLHHKTKRYLLY